MVRAELVQLALARQRELGADLRHAAQRLAKGPGPVKRLGQRLRRRGSGGGKRQAAGEVILPPNLSREARGEVHALAEKHRLRHQSKGHSEAERFIVVSQPQQPRAA